jgi:hypothetical protein
MIHSKGSFHTYLVIKDRQCSLRWSCGLCGARRPIAAVMDQLPGWSGVEALSAFKA